MSVFRKRNLLVGIAIFVIAIGACAAIWGVPKFLKRSTSVKSQVTAYLLDDQGNVNGLLLASGDQLHFSPQTGAVVASQIKVGDEVTATGHAGSQSSYGREVRVEQISANGRTIVEAEAGPPRPHEPHDKRGPRDREDRAGGPGPREVPEARAQGGTQPPRVGAEATPTEQGRAAGNDPNAKRRRIPSRQRRRLSPRQQCRQKYSKPPARFARTWSTVVVTWTGLSYPAASRCDFRRGWVNL